MRHILGLYHIHTKQINNIVKGIAIIKLLSTDIKNKKIIHNSLS
jgi:hypothetical protein